MIMSLRCNWFLSSYSFLLIWLPVFVGCASVPPDAPVDVGTNMMIFLPENGSPLLTDELVQRIVPGMSQDDVLAILQAATCDSAAARSPVDAAVTQSRRNSVRYELTVTQGKRILVLSFREGKLADKRLRNDGPISDSRNAA